jgi:plasmid stabilization system protein ParE
MRLEEIRSELERLLAQFPELGRSQRATGSKRRRHIFTAAQRRAIGERMRKYWAERRAQSGSKTLATTRKK